MHNLLTIEEAARFLSVHKNTLRDWERKGYLVPFRIGPRRDRRYKREDLLKQLDTVDNSNVTELDNA